MKTQLPKESESHKEIISQIVETIKKVGGTKISHIILFGSFARGTWINEIKEESDGRLLDYISDYDVLVITEKHNDGVGSRAVNLESKINKKIETNKLDKQHPTSIIIESLSRVNDELKKGQYFFTDIKKEGILFYQNKNVQDLAEPKELNNTEKREIAQKYFDIWIKKSHLFFENAKDNLRKSKEDEGYLKLSAFNLHQATECLYQCAHLVFTNYSPRLHDLEKINKPLVYFSKKFFDIFPKNTKEEKDNFDLLKRAYVEARYNENYKITKEQLAYLVKRVEKLKAIVEEVCLKKIDSFDKK